MTASLDRRVDRAEEALIIGEDQILLQQLVCQNYNLRTISTEGFDVYILCLFGDIDMPKWVQDEIDRPIPADASATRIRKGEMAARCDMTGKQGGPAREQFENAESIISGCFESVSKFAQRPIESFEDLQDWLSKRGDRRAYETVMESVQDQGGSDGIIQ